MFPSGSSLASGPGLDTNASSMASLAGGTGVNTINAGGTQTGAGEGDLNTVSSYFKNLLSGNPSQVNAAVAPQVDAIHSQFSQIKNMFQTNQQRGGGTTSTLASLPTKEQGQIEGLTQSAETSAAGQLGQIGGQEAQIGLGEEGVGANLINAATGSATQLQGQEFSLMGNVLGALI